MDCGRRTVQGKRKQTSGCMLGGEESSRRAAERKWRGQTAGSIIGKNEEGTHKHMSDEKGEALLMRLPLFVYKKRMSGTWPTYAIISKEGSVLRAAWPVMQYMSASTQ